MLLSETIFAFFWGEVKRTDYGWAIPFMLFFDICALIAGFIIYQKILSLMEITFLKIILAVIVLIPLSIYCIRYIKALEHEPFILIRMFKIFI